MRAGNKLVPIWHRDVIVPFVYILTPTLSLRASLSRVPSDSREVCN